MSEALEHLNANEAVGERCREQQLAAGECIHQARRTAWLAEGNGHGMGGHALRHLHLQALGGVAQSSVPP